MNVIVQHPTVIRYAATPMDGTSVPATLVINLQMISIAQVIIILLNLSSDLYLYMLHI